MAVTVSCVKLCSDMLGQGSWGQLWFCELRYGMVGYDQSWQGRLMKGR